jgi:transposase
MMRVDAWYVATQPCDMRGGMDSLLARVIKVFGAAQPHVAYAFANARATRIKVLLSDGYGLWLCTRRLHSGGFTWPRQGPSGKDAGAGAGGGGGGGAGGGGGGGGGAGGACIALTPEQWEALTLGLPWTRLGRAIELT